jgi:hypothetical protein
MRSGVATADSRTFHSNPSTSAERDRLLLPTNAVSKPELRWKSHALACNRVVRVS